MFRFLAHTHRLVCFAAAILVVLSIDACKEEALESGSSNAEGGHVAGLSPKQASLVLARVGDTSITLGEFAATLERMDQFDRLRYKTPERRRELLKEMITVELLAREAERRGLDKDPRTQEGLRQILRDAILRDARARARAPVDFSASEVRAYYEAHKEQYREPERRRISHVVVKDKAQAERLLKEAKKISTPTEWGEFVLKNSVEYADAPFEGPKETAGDLGLVGAPGEKRADNPRVEPEVRQAAFQIQKVGTIVDRVVADSKGGFHLVRLVAVNRAHARTFSEAERTIRIIMSQREIAAQEKQLEAELREKFPVTIDDAALAATEMPKPNAKHLPGLDASSSGHKPPRPPKSPSGHGQNHAH